MESSHCKLDIAFISECISLVFPMSPRLILLFGLIFSIVRVIHCGRHFSIQLLLHSWHFNDLNLVTKCQEDRQFPCFYPNLRFLSIWVFVDLLLYFNLHSWLSFFSRSILYFIFFHCPSFSCIYGWKDSRN